MAEVILICKTLPKGQCWDAKVWEHDSYLLPWAEEEQWMFIPVFFVSGKNKSNTEVNRGYLLITLWVKPNFLLWPETVLYWLPVLSLASFLILLAFFSSIIPYPTSFALPWSSGCFPTMPDIFLSQDFCSGYCLYLEQSSPNYPHDSAFYLLQIVIPISSPHWELPYLLSIVFHTPLLYLTS